MSADTLQDLRWAMAGAVSGTATAAARLADGLRCDLNAPVSIIARARDAEKALRKEADALALEIAIFDRCTDDTNRERDDG